MPQALLLSTALQNLLASDSQDLDVRAQPSPRDHNNRPRITSPPLPSPQAKPPIQRFSFLSLTVRKRLAYQWVAEIQEDVGGSAICPRSVCAHAQQVPNAKLHPDKDAVG